MPWRFPCLRADWRFGGVTRIDGGLEPGSPFDPTPPGEQTDAKPFVELEKSRFVVGEQVLA